MDTSINEFWGWCDGGTRRTARGVCDDKFVDTFTIPHGNICSGSVHDDTHIGRDVPLPHLDDGIFDDCIFGVNGCECPLYIKVSTDDNIILYVGVSQDGEDIRTFFIHVKLCTHIESVYGCTIRNTHVGEGGHRCSRAIEWNCIRCDITIDNGRF